MDKELSELLKELFITEIETIRNIKDNLLKRVDPSESVEDGINVMFAHVEHILSKKITKVADID